MTLEVVGAGFGRTGTNSLKLALEILGFNPCYHMSEIFDDPEQALFWRARLDDDTPDWDTLFSRYGAAVDWPACFYWETLAARYSRAKVLLTVRDPQRWYDSMCKTIFPELTQDTPDDPLLSARHEVARTLIFERTFGGRIDDRAHVIGVYERHTENVKRVIPADRLLVHEVAEGWAPLCAFLDRPLPEAPFPRVNSSAEFREQKVE